MGIRKLIPNINPYDLINDDDRALIKQGKTTENQILTNLIFAMTSRPKKPPQPKFYLGDTGFLFKIDIGEDIPKGDAFIVFETKNYKTERPIQINSNPFNYYTQSDDFKETGKGYGCLKFVDGQTIQTSTVFEIEIDEPYKD